MNSLQENNEITSRDIIILVSMLSVVLLTIVGILLSFDKTVCDSIWHAFSQSNIVKCFVGLWSRML